MQTKVGGKTESRQANLQRIIFDSITVGAYLALQKFPDLYMF